MTAPTTVLLVEDDSADSQLIRRAFEKAGFAMSLMRAKDGDDAVAYLDGTERYEDREKYPLPCLVLLDIKLPRRSGFEVLSWIRRDPRPLRRMPVVMLTSSQHTVDINRAYELGANAYTVKPDTSAKLVELLGSLKDFWIEKNEFPVMAQSPQFPATQTEAQAHRDLVRRILLVEDERTDALLITRAFTRAGFPGVVEHAPDGRLALEWLDKQISLGAPSLLPSLVLLDMRLPGMSGLELLDAIRSRRELKRVPVVVLASAQDAETVNRAYERGANSYLVKSANPDDVGRLIQFVQQYWLIVNRGSTTAVKN
ncbi:MAG TPA: response regulator [Acidobacteriaceae bacterium]|jgi:CheY-like chemotaxis protein|nr:response regulator [Acidobacteriaceae bacterium]